MSLVFSEHGHLVAFRCDGGQVASASCEGWRQAPSQDVHDPPPGWLAAEDPFGRHSAIREGHPPVLLHLCPACQRARERDPEPRLPDVH